MRNDDAFKKFYANMRKSEGGYVNNPADRGGETYAGVSRKNFPNWKGWAIIDTLKSRGVTKAKELDAILARNFCMEELLEDFYFNNFYAPFNK